MGLRTSAANLLRTAAQKLTFREAAGTTVADDDEGWRKLSGDVKRDLAPVTQSRMREMAAYLWQANLLANRLIELPLAFLLAEGVRLQVKDEEAQGVLDAFWCDPINSMDIKLTKRVRELALFGEQCYPAFVNEVDGAVRLGYLDPALIDTVVTDPANPEQPVGIVTVKDAAGQARKLRVIVNGPEEVFAARTQELRQTFTDGECFYFAVNALSSGARGRSDLLAQADWLDAYDDFLFGEQDRAKYLRAFIWDVTVKGLTEDQIKAKAASYAPPGANTVRFHNESEVWAAVSPSLNSADTSESARMLRNHVLGGSSIPEHWFGGGGDVNRAVGAEMGEPAFKMFSMRQREIKHLLEEIGRFVLRSHALAAGASHFDLAKPEFSVEAVFPEMIARDTTRYAAALQQVVVAAATAVDKGYLTKATAIKIIASVAGRLGVEIDAEAELADAATEAADKAKEDLFAGDPETPPVAATA